MSAEVQMVSSVAPANEIFAEVIAGPETAARLGVPVGTRVSAIHIHQPLDGSPATERDISLDEIDEMRLRGELMSPEPKE